MKKNTIILSRTPFRLPLGGGSTDLPSYYQKYGGFIFAVAINIYMDIFIKEPLSDDYIHMHYTQYEAELEVEKIKHTIGREALKMAGIKNRVLISFNADTPSGTGLGSSGACAVSLLKGLNLYQGREMSNLEAAEQSFILTQNLQLPDGKQDPYICALGGFVVLDIDTTGAVKVTRPAIALETSDRFWQNSLFFYTGIRRNSQPILAAQNEEKIFALKHRTKEIGQKIYQHFLNGDLDAFGSLMDEHWQVKKAMTDSMSNDWFDEIYNAAKKAGALGGKILGAGGGGYFLFYCPSETAKSSVRQELQKFNLRELSLGIDTVGARAQTFYF
jgi:D-glycero-alpha-D-manno-heptose-7-phosphate kinase